MIIERVNLTLVWLPLRKHLPTVQLLSYAIKSSKSVKLVGRQKYYNEDDEIGKTETYENNVLKLMKIPQLFQIMFYNFHNGNKQTPLHVINLVETYEQCKSRDFITSLNQSGLWITNSSGFGLLSLSHFSSSAFTIFAFDNIDHVDKNMLSGKSGSYDTVISYFKKLLLRKE